MPPSMRRMTHSAKKHDRMMEVERQKRRKDSDLLQNHMKPTSVIVQSGALKGTVGRTKNAMDSKDNAALENILNPGPKSTFSRRPLQQSAQNEQLIVK